MSSSERCHQGAQSLHVAARQHTGGNWRPQMGNTMKFLWYNYKSYPEKGPFGLKNSPENQALYTGWAPPR